MRAYLESVNHGVALVTPSRRMTSLVSDRYHVAMLAAGHTTWEAPRVLPFAAWLDETFQHLAITGYAEYAGKILLSLDQERVLWEQVVREGNVFAVDRVEHMAVLAMNAWSTAMLWELPFDEIVRRDGRQEVRAFIHWVSRFEQRCRDLNALDQHTFALRLAAPGSPPSEAPAEFQFFGFTRLPRLLKRLARHLGSSIDEATEQGHTPRKTFDYREYGNSEIELAAAMGWASEQKRLRPHASVSVALAGVRRIDANLEQRLRRAFLADAKTDDGVGRAQLHCAVSESLADVALVQAALLIIDSRSRRSWDEISRLLLSPYIGEAVLERESRALLDAQLRRRGNVEVSITSVIDTALNGSVRCPALVTRLQAMLARAQEMPERQSMHEWMTFTEKLLTAVGWPGERELNRDEQASLSEWHRAMDAAAQLDAVSPTCGWLSAFGRWRAILRSRRLLPPVEVNAVQLVTIEEAAYLESDALWVAGLHDGAWPDAIEISPLLPFSVQREYGLPGADPVRELNYADGVLHRVHAHNRETILSYARLDGETLRRKFANLSATPIDTTANAPWPRRGAPEEYDLIDDSYASEIQTHMAVTGGVGLFTDQAACPMRAFGRHRLKAQSPLDATPGLNAMQRGSLIHALMANFWQRMESSARLHAATEAEIRQIFALCAEAVVAEFRVRYHLLDPYWDLERERLCELGQEWLKLELQRGDFDVIACEHSRAATIGTHTINMRIDRVDRLANGEVLIVDYKTGDVPRRSWETPRPDQPQLPLYAVTTTDESVAGIAYARIKKGDCKIVDEPIRITGDSNASADLRTQWRAQMEAWRAAMEELANEIDSGFAVANPKHGTATCRYCDLQCFCRIHESRPDQALERDDED